MQSGKANTKGTERPKDLHFTDQNRKFDCDGNINITFNKSYSDDDISPSEMNCKKVIDKPTLVKRLTMGLLRINDQESRPLGMYHTLLRLNGYKPSFHKFKYVRIV